VRRLLLLGAAAAAACSGSGRTYHNSDLQLAPAFQAKAMCSCLFVMGQTEPFCSAWSRQSPAVASYQIDWGGKSVESSAGMFWGARAYYVSQHFGCTVEGL
jgi:hypothetical protein